MVSIGITTREELDAALPALFEAVRVVYEDGSEDDGLFDANRPLMNGDIAIVEAAMLALANDPRWQARAAVAQVLRYLVGPSAPTRVERPIDRALERACLLVGMAQTEGDARVRLALVSAFVDLKHDIGDVLAAAFVCRFANEPDASMRGAVVAALCGNQSDQAIATLITLSRDADESVRDWACFGLGHQLGSPGMPGGIVDTDEIRDALAARLDDPNVEASEEAATGLALRGDPRGIERMLLALERFEQDGVTERVLMTASEAPDARYVPRLEEIVRECPALQSAVRALEDCRAVKPRFLCGSPRQHAGCDCFRAMNVGKPRAL